MGGLLPKTYLRWREPAVVRRTREAGEEKALPMSKRRLFRAVGLLLVALGVALLVPDVRWVLHGWWRGEPFYKMMPSSYWRKEVAEYGTPRGGLPGSSPLDNLSNFIGIRAPRSLPAPSVLTDDPQAVPVLLVLLNDRDSVVRVAAAFALARSATETLRGVKALVKELRDGGADDDGAVLAAVFLGRLGTKARGAVPELVDMARNGADRRRARFAGIALKQIDPQAAAEAGVP